MLKIALKLTRSEVNVLYIYSGQALAAWSDPRNRPNLFSQVIQVAEHYERIRKQAYTWSDRPTNKEYKYTLSVSLACAYYHSLQRSQLESIDLDSLLAKLDIALINCHLKPQLL